MRRTALLALVAIALVACQPDPTHGHRPPASVPAYRSSVRAATRDDVRLSWHDGCPVSWTDLSVVTVDYWGFDGRRHHDPLVVADTVAADVARAFGSLFRQGFQVQRIHRVDDYGADDERSMRANNTSAFNCRPVAGTSTWSEHSYGTAVDVNPMQNPYVVHGTYDPPGSEAWADRTQVTPGMAVAGGSLVGAFDAIGWTWGGTWKSKKDYQHFSLSGR